MPRKVAHCVKCGIVRTIVSKRRCKSCYSRASWKKKHPIISKVCTYPKCKKPFRTRKTNKIYCSLRCQIKALRQNAKRKVKYLRSVRRRKCPNCHGNYKGILREVKECYKGKVWKIRYETWHYVEIWNPLTKKRKHKWVKTCRFKKCPRIP